MAQTGIDVFLELNKAQQVVSKLLHVIHADGIVRAGTDSYTLVVKLDGAEHRLHPLGHHFLPAAPGEHAVEVALADFLGPHAVTSKLTRITLHVSVEPDRVTVVRFRWPSAFDHLTLEEVSSRAASEMETSTR